MDGQGQSQVQQRLQRLVNSINIQAQLDRVAPYTLYRWIALGVLVLIYLIRVWALKGFYIVTYALGIYNLNIVLAFITPAHDPESEGPTLPQRGNEEYKPFARKLPEFKAWWQSFQSWGIGLVCTLFKALDVPVFWPILLMYWIMLVALTMQRQIKHMIKYRYLPVSIGKRRYKVGMPPAAKGTAPPAK